MDKNVHIINGFVDLGTAKVGECMKFLHNGQWHQTSPIIRAQVAGDKVLVETQNSIYANFDFMREKSQSYEQAKDVWRHQQAEYQPPTLEQALAARCLDGNKSAKIIGDFNVERLIKVERDGSRWYVGPDNIQVGDHVQLKCNVFDIERGTMSSGLLDIPSVQDFVYQDSQLLIESRSSMFSSIDFSRELAEIKMERAQNHQIDIER